MTKAWNAIMAWAEVLAEYRRQTGQLRGFY